MNTQPVFPQLIYFIKSGNSSSRQLKLAELSLVQVKIKRQADESMGGGGRAMQELNADFTRLNEHCERDFTNTRPTRRSCRWSSQ